MLIGVLNPKPTTIINIHNKPPINFRFPLVLKKFLATYARAISTLKCAHLSHAKITQFCVSQPMLLSSGIVIQIAFGGVVISSLQL